MSVRTRLTLSLVGIALLLSVPALYGVNRLQTVRDIAVELKGRHAAAQVALGELQVALDRADQAGRRYTALGEEEAWFGMTAALAAGWEAAARLDSAGYERDARVVAQQLDALSVTAQRLRELVAAGRMQAATAWFGQVAAQSAVVRRATARTAARVDERSTEAATRAENLSRRATATAGIALGVALLLALMLGGILTRGFTRPLRDLRSAMAVVADGRFAVPEGLDFDREDELGALSRSFRAMTERLAELSRLRAEVVGMATHSLKTPINVIAGYAEMLREEAGDLSEAQETFLGEIEEQADELLERVRGLLQMSRVEAGELNVSPEPVPVESLLHDLNRSFRALSRQKRVELHVVRESTAPETVQADPDRLRDEVLGNLLDNAFKHTDTGGEVSVTAYGEGESLVLEVADTGTGIPAADLEHVFERYYQARGDEGREGIGLGLAVAREVVGAHGGRIEVESEVGEGTTFRVRLPAKGMGTADPASGSAGTSLRQSA